MNLWGKINMDEIFIYVDEAGNPNIKDFKGTDDKRFFQVGAAVFSHEVKQEVIDRAMSELRKVDSSMLTKSDLKTLKRGYFHTSEDGPYAKSKLMYEANKFTIEFYVNKYDKQKHFDLGLTPLTQQELHFLLIHLSSVIGLNYGVKKINLFVAQRDKSFSSGAEQKWIDSFYQELINSLSQNPAIKTPFPELNVSIVNGQHPGVQITDLLLWATTRKNRTTSPEDVWYNRIKIGTSSNANIPNDPISMSDFYVNKRISKNTSDIFYKITPSDLDNFEETLGVDKFHSLLMWMEDVVLKNFENKDVDYLNSYFKKAVHLIQSPDKLSPEEVKTICEAFLMLFDTIKIAEGLVNDELKFALIAKRYAVTILAGRDIRWFKIASEWGRLHPFFYKNRTYR